MKRIVLLFVVVLLLVLVACTTPAPTTEPPTVTPESPIVTPTPGTSPLVTPVLTATAMLTETVGRADSATFEKPESQTMEETKMSGTILELLTAAAFLSLVANRLVEGLVKPFFDKFKWDKFFLMPISWVFGGLLVGASGINLFAAIPGVSMSPAIGLVLSALVAGGGSNLMHELFGALGQGRKAAQ